MRLPASQMSCRLNGLGSQHVGPKGAGAANGAAMRITAGSLKQDRHMPFAQPNHSYHVSGIRVRNVKGIALTRLNGKYCVAAMTRTRPRRHWRTTATFA